MVSGLQNSDVAEKCNLLYGLDISENFPSGVKFLRYLFDLTTTAQWRGPAVGIVRVEQELARRARRFLGKDVAFCVYDRTQEVMLAIDDAKVGALLEGRIRIDFSGVRPDRVSEGAIRRRIRLGLLRNATLYHFLQRVRGRSFTRDQILQIQAEELSTRRSRSALESGAASNQPREPEIIPIADLRPHRAQLDTDTMVISGGLDWQYKDLRALWKLKQAYGFCYCAVVYDLIAIRFPHFVVPGYVELLTDYFGELISLADRAMCISQSTKEDWLRHVHQVGAEAKSSGVFPLGCDLPRAKTSRGDLPSILFGKKFALYVSTIEPRKNHYMLYQAWEECIRTGLLDPERYRLVFVGRRGWATGDMLYEIQTNPLTKDTIVILDDVSDEQLVGLYRNCAFVLFPSMYEGFGLPLVEALGYRKPCVSSNAGALSESGGELVIRLDPKDTLAWSRMIGRLMLSSSELQIWENRVKQQYVPTTWNDAAVVFFEAIAASSRDRPKSAGKIAGKLITDFGSLRLS